MSAGPASRLPESYGTGKLFLAARDPHCVYAHWDLAESQQRHYQALAGTDYLTLRVYPESLAGEPESAIRVGTETRHRFLHVERAGAIYLCQLGYVSPAGQWVTVATSEPVTTPPEAAAPAQAPRWATVPVISPAPQGPRLGLRISGEGRPRERQPSAGDGELRAPRLEWRPAAAPDGWSPARERALEKVLRSSLARQRPSGSAVITEWIQREVSQPAAAPAAPAALPISISSPAGGEALGISSAPPGRAPAERGFWFNVNAELIIYGATEPSARVSIGGRPIRLRPDGSFSCRFALPDGQYELAVAAVSVHEDTRRADLAFSRRTQYQGEVGAHPQDQALKPPAAENVPTL